ncbi:porin [Rhizorhabdus histidinilytica]
MAHRRGGELARCDRARAQFAFLRRLCGSRLFPDRRHPYLSQRHLRGAKPSSPFGKGGIGAIQLNLRYDYLDLNDGAIRGGTQNGWFAGIIWTPVEYLRFNLNYGYLAYTGAAIPAGGRTDYGMHVGGARVELDF